MNPKKLRLLVVINPNASRAEEALPTLTEWFGDDTNAMLVIAHKKKDLKALLRRMAPRRTASSSAAATGRCPRHCPCCSS